MFKVRAAYFLASVATSGGLFGVGGVVDAKQRTNRSLYEGKSLADAFPAIAAMWVSDFSERNKLADPSSLDCLSTKKQKWCCTSCGHVYGEVVVRVVDAHGVCPKCGSRPTASLPTASVVSAKKLGRKSGNQHAFDVSPSLRQRGSIEPMLATEWKQTIAKHDFSKETLLASPKLDGLRCIITFAPEINDIIYISRKGTVFESCGVLTPELLPLFKRDPKLMLDGEIYYPHVPFDTLTSWVRTTAKGLTPEIAKKQKLLQFHAFDIMYSKHFDETKTFYPKRLELLASMIPAKSSNKSNAQLQHVGAFPMAVENADKYLEKAIHNKYEGIMVRRSNFPYGFGKRNNALMKHKVFDTAEFVVQDVMEGVGRCSGQAGSLRMVTAKGTTFYATPRSEAELRTKLWRQRKQIIGKAVTVQFQGLSNGGVPRFPVAISVRGAPDGSDWL